MGKEMEALERLKEQFARYAEQHREGAVDLKQRAAVQNELATANYWARDMVAAEIAKLKESTK